VLFFFGDIGTFQKVHFSFGANKRYTGRAFSGLIFIERREGDSNSIIFTFESVIFYFEKPYLIFP